MNPFENTDVEAVGLCSLCGTIRGAFHRGGTWRTIDHCQCGLRHVQRIERYDGTVWVLHEEQNQTADTALFDALFNETDDTIVIYQESGRADE